MAQPYLQKIQQRRDAIEIFDEQPREPTPATLEAVHMFIGLLEEHHGHIPSKLVLAKAKELGIKKFHLDIAKNLLKLEAKRITLEKLIAKNGRGSGCWLTCVSADTPEAIEELRNPKPPTPTPTPLTESEQLLLELKHALDAGTLKRLTLRLPNRIIQNAEIPAKIFFSINQPTELHAKYVLELARALRGRLKKP